MADINVSVTVPSVITATATDPNHITVAVTNPAPITVSASVGNSGDMMKSVYDTDNDGVVDNAEALGGVAASNYVQTGNASWVDLTDGGATTLHSHAGGSGDVVGPASATSDGNIAIFNGTTGKIIKDSEVYISTIVTGSQVAPIESDAIWNAPNAPTPNAGDKLALIQDGEPVTLNSILYSSLNVHSPVTVADSTSIDLTLTGQQVSAAAIFGTTATTIAQGNHTHTGVYEPADATIIKTGSTNWIDLTDGGATTLHSHALASGVNWGNTLIAKLASDASTAADVNPISLSGLSFSFAANSTYTMQLFGAVSAAANTTGNGFQVDISAAVTSVWHTHFHQLANTGTLSGGNSIADDTSAGVSSGIPGTGTYPVSGFGVLITGANTGTAQLNFRSEVAAVATCRAGTTWIVTKVA